jgi:hypothetical protein
VTTCNANSETGFESYEWMLLLRAHQAASSSILMRSDFKNLTS